MKYIHTKGISDYNDGYTDGRCHKWFKCDMDIFKRTYGMCIMPDKHKYRFLALMWLEARLAECIPFDENFLDANIIAHPDSWHEEIDYLLSVGAIMLVDNQKYTDPKPKRIAKKQTVAPKEKFNKGLYKGMKKWEKE